jgi:hypothetical protein
VIMPFAFRNVVAVPRLQLRDSAQPFCSPNVHVDCNTQSDAPCCGSDGTIYICGTGVDGSANVRSVWSTHICNAGCTNIAGYGQSCCINGSDDGDVIAACPSGTTS